MIDRLVNPDLDSVPEALREVVASCFAKDPDQRPSVPMVLTELGVGVDTDLTEAAEQTVRAGWDAQVQPVVEAPGEIDSR